LPRRGSERVWTYHEVLGLVLAANNWVHSGPGHLAIELGLPINDPGAFLWFDLKRYLVDNREIDADIRVDQGRCGGRGEVEAEFKGLLSGEFTKLFDFF
jgi:hypothetical protein